MSARVRMNQGQVFHSPLQLESLHVSRLCCFVKGADLQCTCKDPLNPSSFFPCMICLCFRSSFCFHGLSHLFKHNCFVLTTRLPHNGTTFSSLLQQGGFLCISLVCQPIRNSLVHFQHIKSGVKVKLSLAYLLETWCSPGRRSKPLRPGFLACGRPFVVGLQQRQAVCTFHLARSPRAVTPQRPKSLRLELV